MFKNKKLHIAALVVGISAVAISAPSFAQRGDCMGNGSAGGKFSEARFSDRMKQHQQRLHDALKLTPQQEPAWTKFQESHPFNNAANRPAQADMAKLTAPERAEKMLELQKQHQEGMSKHLVAMKDFYGQLSPEQKKAFDEQSQMGQRGQRSGRGAGPQGPGAGAPASTN